MTYWHFASAPSGGCGLHDLFLGLVLGGELASFLLGVVLGSGLVFGGRPEHSLDSVQCLGLDSYLGFVCSREMNGGFYWASWVCSV